MESEPWILDGGQKSTFTGFNSRRIRPWGLTAEYPREDVGRFILYRFGFFFLGAMLTVRGYVADASHWTRIQVREQILEQRAYSR